MPPATLIALPLSPWSEKARWALDHHDVAYVEKVYVPMLGAPALRWKLRRLRGRVTVPILFDPSGTVCLDSLDIARYAESTGGGEPLFRRGHEQEIARWNRLSDEAMQAARALITLRMTDDHEAQHEALAGVVPRGLAGLFRPAATLALRFLQRKYRVREADEAVHRARLHEILLELRRALGGRRFLVGDALSYCDIAMASALLGVEPGDTSHLPFGPATRRSSTDLELAGEFTDLLGWRDQIYAQHRRARTGTPLLG
ncbi:MAG TPA: glutathione S-transferase [Kofleriaceae bacterium]|nr:glutathione S-transferase [Kofleriaceae bacterium]